MRMLKGFMIAGSILALVQSASADLDTSANLPTNCFGKQVSTAQAEEVMTRKSTMDAFAVVPEPFKEVIDILTRFAPEPVNYYVEQSDEFNAYATRNFGRRVVVLYSGLMKHPASNKDMVALVACHETGHHFAGAPFYGFSGMSVEGQSDYYATQKCFDNWVEKSVAFDPQDAEAKAYCETSIRRPDAKCVRSLSAALKLGRIIAEAKNYPKPTLEARDPAVVTRTFPGHPMAQCRVDTYQVGYLVQNFGMPSQDPRPRCWFAGN